MKKGLLILAAAVMMMAPLSASAAVRVFVGGPVYGAYAGTTRENRTMHLRPGNYNIEIRENGQTAFAQNVYVTVGRTLHLHPAL